MALKTIPLDSKHATPIGRARGQLADLLKKDGFLTKALSEWCDEILNLEKPIGWSDGYAESPFDTTPLSRVKFGTQLVLTAQRTINRDLGATRAKHPELDRTRTQRAESAVPSRRQAMVDRGILERPKAVVKDQLTWHEQVAQQLRERESLRKGDSSRAGVSPDLQSLRAAESTISSQPSPP